jgi:hypothetical protein
MRKHEDKNIHFVREFKTLASITPIHSTILKRGLGPPITFSRKKESEDSEEDSG